MDNIWMPMHDFEAIRDLMAKDDAQLFRDFYNSQTIKHMNYLLIAQVAHEVNRAYCLGIGDTSQKSWEEAEQWQRDSAVKGVEYKANNLSATPEDQHEAWSQSKIADGWVYGEVKDAEKKTHPCLVPYSELPMDQRVKDYLFVAVVGTMLVQQKEDDKQAPEPTQP